MIECVKCGHPYLLGEPSCSRCTWPFSTEAWSSTTLRVRRITLDTGCINAKRRDLHLNKLESWEEAGRLQLQRSGEMLRELSGRQRVAKAETISSHPNLFRLGLSVLDGPDVLAGPDLGGELHSILFPTTQQLTANQKSDIEHLRLHVQTGGDLFVTLNKNDFITQGRQDRLLRRGI